jgi:hypothetical protein
VRTYTGSTKLDLCGFRERDNTMATYKNETDPPRTIIVYDADYHKTIQPGETAIIYKPISEPGMTKISDTPYYSPVQDSNLELEFTGEEEKTITVTSVHVQSLLITHISAGFITIHYNDVTTPGLRVLKDERLMLPVNQFARTFVLVSSETLKCDVVQIHQPIYEGLMYL